MRGHGHCSEPFFIEMRLDTSNFGDFLGDLMRRQRLAFGRGQRCKACITIVMGTVAAKPARAPEKIRFIRVTPFKHHQS
jgi:hypothetical protein